MRASVFQAAVLVVVLAVALYGCTTGGSTSSSTPTASSTSSSSSTGGGNPTATSSSSSCTSNSSNSTPFSSTSSNLLPPTSASSSSQSPSTTSLTSDEKAAGGPIAGNLCLYQSELKCVQAQNNAGWFPSLVHAEQSDSQRTHLFPCADFTGSYTGSNQVFAWRSANLYDTPGYTVSKSPNEYYVEGGSSGDATPTPSGPFVARMDPITGQQVWRTVLDNTNASGQWNVGAAINLPADGNPVVEFGYQLAKLDAQTGAILARVSPPVGSANPLSVNFDGLVAAPDGTLFPKDQTRAPNCTVQGFSGLFECPSNAGTPPNTVLSALDPKTLQVLDSIELPASVGGRDTLSVFNGKDYIYLVAATTVYRFIWNPTTKKLSQDTSWQPAPYGQPGQGGGSAPAVMGDWLVFMTNGNPATAPLSVIAINQANAKQVVRINPIPLSSPTQGFTPSYAPANVSVDPENNMIYAFDSGPGTQVGIKFQNGKMSTVWSVKARTLSFMTLVGPQNQRVFVATNMSAPQKSPSDFSYTEQIQWRNAENGNLLAQSDFFNAMSPGILITPAYGGRFYDSQAHCRLPVQVRSG